MLPIATYHLFSFLEEPNENACMEHMPKQGDDTYHTCIFNIDWKKCWFVKLFLQTRNKQKYDFRNLVHHHDKVIYIVHANDFLKKNWCCVIG
jgi:hypothetical protein